MRTLPTISSAALVVLAWAAPPLLAQPAPPPPYAMPVSCTLRCDTLTNLVPYARFVNAQWIHVRGAPSLRVFFKEVDVGQGSGLLVSSLQDGSQHFITEAEVVKWGSSSAFMNGDTLLLELYLAPGARGSYEVDHLLVGLPHVAEKSICGPTDDRIPSSDNRSLRMLNSSGTAACSGWLASADDCAFSAGHCFPTYASVAEVNVPLSGTDGSLKHPPVQDQFPIDPSSLIINYSGLGDDWALCRLNTNSLGQSAATLHGWFNLGFFFPSPGETIRITGYGSDTGTSNQTNQTNTGPYAYTSGTVLNYTVDTEGGNSGSVVIHEATGNAVAVHTNGGCSGSGGSNAGTSVNNTGLQNAWTQNCASGPPAPPVASFTSDVTVAVVTQAIHFIDTSSGVPASWDWDFDEDGITDSVLRNPTHAYSQAGNYDVRLTVANALGTSTITVLDYVTINPIAPVTPPYSEDFTNGLPADGHWLFQSSSLYGSITAGSHGTGSPKSGHPELLLAAQSAGSYVTNDAVLLFQLDQNGEALVQYSFKDIGDEDDAEDGLFLSNGITEVKLLSHVTSATNWMLKTADLGAAAAAAGFSPGAPLRLVFRQRDNYDIPTDGHAIDDVALSSPVTLTAAPAVLSAAAGGTVAFSLDPGVSHAGAFYALIGTGNGTAPGFDALGYHFSVNPDFFFTLTVTQPNQAPFSTYQGVLDGSGHASAAFLLPPGISYLAGRTFHHQFAVVTGTQIDYVSNVVKFSIAP
ncbi:MAG: PKD domain-containing protein [Planctomycetes bacterium]|nr:PKD domain-containing protein [Planctomycetota bacterium]